MAVRRSTRSTRRNGATTELEITFTGRRRIAAAWKNPSPGIVAFRIKKAERLGLTYEEYTLEILERGRHLQIEDVERIAEIKQRRAARAAAIGTPRKATSFARSHIHAGYPDQNTEILARYLRDAQ